ncbi:LuxR family transcriptional regulator [Nocardia sp. NBC_00565]|uniref:LuxR family transcriptional regulator n=1 Tax=Nocardia sp. NBC_00565 TaxID=2975993 RepID=UPI002E8016B5|nr:LuxR family transcriptional regulator [Nocardia sp. NBC_00565]WUC00276.1 LuxR family transcriptional regulator [Nocardia sp. NBC_00565]
MLFGRAVETELIMSFVTGGPGGAAVLVLTGEAGVGKTALLDTAAEIATRHGSRVLRAAALEFEAELQFGALNQLLQPMIGGIDGLDAPHRGAIRTVLGLAAGALPSQLIVGAATLALLRAWAEAEGSPVLLVVDDVQWLDLSSSMALIYALRRLAGAEVRLLAATRVDADDAFMRSGFRVHDVAPLDDLSAEELLTTAYPALSAVVRRRLRADARGNPLALLELPTTFEIQDATARLPEVLPLTRRLQTLFAERLESLPEDTRRMLLFVVLAGTENSTTLGDCVPTPEGRDDLPPAERAGVVRANPRTGRLEFRHPLIRSAVVEQSTSAERRAAHRILADAFARSPQRRAWHLGQAATGPDEDVAGLLEAVSQQMVHDGDSGRATATMLRAAELSPADSDRARRTARAAYLGSLITGELSDTGRLLRDTPDSGTSGQSLAVALAASFQLLNNEGDAATASRLLLAALRNTADLEPDEETVVEALHTLLYIGFYSGRQELWPDIRDALDRVLPRPADTLSLLSGPFVDPVHTGAKALADLDTALDELRYSSDPVRIVRVATAGSYLDRVGRVREPLQRVIEDGRDGGAVAKAIEALFLLGIDDFACGAWDQLIDATTEGLRLCADLGYLLTAGPGQFLRGLVAAARGDAEMVDQLGEQLLLWAAPRKLATFAAYSSHLRCLYALGTSAFSDAYRHAVAINPPGTFLPHTPHALWLVLDLTEAAARSGRIEEARAHARAANSAGLAELSPRLEMITNAALAVGHPDEARSLFEAALAVPGIERWVFDRARIELLYGEHLRRERATAAARTHLGTAATVFTQLGAEPWVRRAQAELRAAGETAPAQGSTALTPREQAVAELAAKGLTNKQIGEQLFLSARTVSTHLHRVFHKLGVTRRGALRDAIERRAESGQ